MNNLELSEDTQVVPVEVFISGQAMNEYDLEVGCHGIIERLHKTSDTREIEEAITNLNGFQAFAGKALSKLIFEFSRWYMLTNPDGNFADWYTQKFGGEKLTVQKHQAIGELLMDDEVPAEVKQLPSKELVSVARARQGGYSLEGAWDDIANAGSEAEVNDIVRKARGKEERTGTLKLKMYADGSIFAYYKSKTGEDIVANVGWFNVADRDSEDTHPILRDVLKMSIARYVNNTHTTLEKE